MVQKWWLPTLRGPVDKSWGIVLATLLCVALYTNPAGILVALLSHANLVGSNKRFRNPIFLQIGKKVLKMIVLAYF